jgi:uncharacterized protein YciI
MTVDMSSEAVERLAAHISKTCGCAIGPNAEQPVAATLRAQAERIKELEARDARIFSGPMIDALLSDVERLKAENAILRTEKHADAEAIGALRDDLARFREDRPFVIGWNDGFEHGVKEAVLALDEQWRENSAVKKAAILDLIEGDTND